MGKTSLPLSFIIQRTENSFFVEDETAQSEIDTSVSGKGLIKLETFSFVPGTVEIVPGTI